MIEIIHYLQSLLGLEMVTDLMVATDTNQSILLFNGVEPLHFLKYEKNLIQMIFIISGTVVRMQMKMIRGLDVGLDITHILI